MKQFIQTFKTGKLELLETPVPTPGAGTALIQTKKSLISVGTERMLIDFAKASLFEKARKQPDKVKQVLDKIKTDGFMTTFRAVQNKLSEPTALGYSNVGVIRELGRQVEGFQVGDRVLSNCAHAEFVIAPQNLMAKIPDNVSDEAATFTVVSSIGLQGIRLANPTLGETFVVIGLGLIGQLTVQLLVANGCRVLGIDIDARKVALAKQFGAEAFALDYSESVIESCIALTGGYGVDGVIVTASTKSNEPLLTAAKLCRQRGRIILVGVTGMEIPRALLYEKEISFQVSCSYGPGRYDSQYEDQGIDYPFGLVRWTENRNFQAVLGLMSQGKLQTDPLITHRYAFDDITNAYELILKSNPLGVILSYPEEDLPLTREITFSQPKISLDQKAVVGFLGVGQFAKGVLLPALAKTNAIPHTIASKSGFSGTLSAKKFGFQKAISDYAPILDSDDINTVFICTRHGQHARLVCEALAKNKHVFVEKPLALTLDELESVKTALSQSKGLLMVGFNRRFSPLVQQLKQQLKQRKNPACITYTVNAGYIPRDHWVHDATQGGGRLLGEGCHFIDTVRFLVGSPIASIFAVKTQGHSETDEDKFSITLTFKDGSIATIHYFANGSNQFPKEQIHVFAENKTYVIDNYKTLKGFGNSIKKSLSSQDKGHSAEILAFIDAASKTGVPPIPYDELFEVSLATLLAHQSLIQRQPISCR